MEEFKNILALINKHNVKKYRVVVEAGLNCNSVLSVVFSNNGKQKVIAIQLPKKKAIKLKKLLDARKN